MKNFLLFWIVITATITVVASDTINDTDGARVSPNNIILFMTDDQDVTANSIDPSVMPILNRLFREGGIEFPNYFVPTGLCCPSRATILRGQYCHNTQIFDNGDLNNATYQSGGWSKFLETGLENETIASLMQAAGYETAMVGKYMNGYNLYDNQQAGLHKPHGWDHWMGLLKCFNFYGPIFCDDGKRILRTNSTVYQTDFIRDWALDFLTNKRDPDKPFFLMITPFAPHSPAIPAKRHKHLFPDAKFPRSASFNPSDEIQQQRPSWIKNLPKLTDKQINDMDHFYRNRLRALQAVDEALESITDSLDKLGLTDTTYFIYTADNGQHFGDHRIPAGKRQAYETDVLVPFFVRGPGIAKGTSTPQVVQSVDLGPTFLDVASSSLSSSTQLLKSTYPMDGKSILPLLTTSNAPDSSNNYNDFRWAALLEMYSGSSNIGVRYNHTKGYYRNHMYPNTYQAVRVINGPSAMTSDENLLYVEWCTGEQELYNMTLDPHQIHNLIIAPVPTTIAHGDESMTTTASEPNHGELLPLVQQLHKLLVRLGKCDGSECYEFEGEFFESGMDVDVKRSLSFESMQSSIRNRLPCHNPPNMPADALSHTHNINMRRQPFAYNHPIPEPFTHGFPFSDGDDVEEELLRIWEAYEHNFY